MDEEIQVVDGETNGFDLPIEADEVTGADD